MKGKQYIDDYLKGRRFRVSNNTSNYTDYEAKLIITTPNEVVIINGVRQIIPGKKGQIILMFRISDAEELYSGDKYVSIHCHAYFVDEKFGNVCFGQVQNVVPIDDVEEIERSILSFLSIFHI